MSSCTTTGPYYLLLSHPVECHSVTISCYYSINATKIISHDSMELISAQFNSAHAMNLKQLIGTQSLDVLVTII